LVLPLKFEQIESSIKTHRELETIMVDESIGRLKPSEECINRNNGNSIASLNLMEDELVVRLSSRLKLSSNWGTTGRRSPHSAATSRDAVAATAMAQVVMVATVVAATQEVVAVGMLVATIMTL
jgi:hypothetical protein